MRVSWEVDNSPADINDVPGLDDVDSELFIRRYSGEVIGTSRSIFGETFLTVACLDKKVRTVQDNKVEWF